MLKREIKYEDFDGEEASDIFYFNISQAELIELEVEYEKGFAYIIEQIVESKDGKELIAWFKRVVLMAHGKKSEDGKRFIKNDQTREEFSQTAAYDALFVELATNEDAAVEFIQAVMPKELKTDQDKPQLPPKPPTN